VSAASPTVARAAADLRAQAAHSGVLHVLTGLRLVEPQTGHWLALDLVVIGEAAVAVGVEARPGLPAEAQPQAAALAVVRLQREHGLDPALPVYAFWLGSAPPGYAGGAPALADAEAVQRFITHVQSAAGRSVQLNAPTPNAPTPNGPAGAPASHARAAALAEHLRRLDIGPVALEGDGEAGTLPAKASPPRSVPALRQALRFLRDLPAQVDAGARRRFQERLRQPWFGRRGQPVRPAEVLDQLEAALFDRDNWLEDARYLKIVPNEFVVELSLRNYEQHYRLIEQHLCAQWQQRLVEALNTANERQGRREFQFGGPVQVRVRPGHDLADDQVRLRSRITPAARPETATACLALWPNGRRWPLPTGAHTLGRDPAANIYLDVANVPDRPLISGLHAYIKVSGGQARLFDGAPSGRASLNGTFVNGRRVPPEGCALANGDIIVLAPLDPSDPRPDAPGTLALVFFTQCPP
jgi:hypothetical protein